MAITQTRPKDLAIYDPDTDLTPQSEIVVMLDHITWSAPKRFVYNFDSLFPDWADATEEDLLTLLGVSDVVSSSDLSGYVPVVEGKSLILDTEIARLASVTQSVYTVLLPTGANIAARLAGSTNVPSGWSLSVDSVVNLQVTHNLTGRKCVDVKVWEIDGSNERIAKPFSDAYSGILANGLTVLVEGLDTIALPLRIEFIFA
jgi:hypothetical protein